jgi:hypothetical protein
MTPTGFVFLLVSVVGVTAFLLWCLTRVLRSARHPGHLAHVEPVEKKDISRR